MSSAITHRILVVEDDPILRLVLVDNLQSEGYGAEGADTGASAVKYFHTSTPDLILLDLTLPDCDGLDLLPVLRLRGQIPIIILTARGQQIEKIKGLRLGADDYMTKPFDSEELLARVRAILRRVHRNIEHLRLGDVLVDFQQKQASRGGKTIAFTQREFELLSYLAERRDLVVPREELLRMIWGYEDTTASSRTVDFAIARLRRKIEVDHHRPQFIRVAHGDGYCLSGAVQSDLPASAP